MPQMLPPQLPSRSTRASRSLHHHNSIVSWSAQSWHSHYLWTSWHGTDVAATSSWRGALRVAFSGIITCSSFLLLADCAFNPGGCADSFLGWILDVEVDGKGTNLWKEDRGGESAPGEDTRGGCSSRGWKPICGTVQQQNVWCADGFRCHSSVFGCRQLSAVWYRQPLWGYFAFHTQQCASKPLCGYDMFIPPATHWEAEMRTDATEWHWVMEKKLGDLKRMGVYEDIDALLEGKKTIGCRWVYEFKIDKSGSPPIYKIKRMGVYDELPEGKKPIGCRWVYEFKINESSGPPIYKTHLAAQGFSQVPFVDYGATFVPIERCDVSLTGETTNTKHTHKRSEAQWPSDAIHAKLVSETLIKSWLWMWVCNLFDFQRCKRFVSPPRGSFIVVRSYLQLILRVGRS